MSACKHSTLADSPKHCYNKWVKRFLIMPSIAASATLLHAGLPSCNTILHDCKYRLREDIHLSSNKLVKMFVN